MGFQDVNIAICFFVGVALVVDAIVVQILVGLEIIKNESALLVIAAIGCGFILLAYLLWLFT